ncbi:MAG: ribonuclease D [Parvularculaceae bacterium]
MDVITKTKALEALCAELATEDYVTVDTEFMRERTYWPQLCLIQVAGAKRAAIIDPLAPDMDLDAFDGLMSNPDVLKVFHSGRQDLEIFFHRTGKVPAPIFDTQIAAMVCGFGDSVAYDKIVWALLRETVDKSSRFTDWSRRPLSEAQLAYALSDVTHLRGVYEKLSQRLEESGRAAWLAEEVAILTNPATYALEPENAWKRLKLRNIKPKHLGPLIEVAAWREKEAQTRDAPRNRILKDEVLVEIARAAPRSPEELGRLRAVPSGFERSAAAGRLLEAVKRGAERPANELPALERKEDRGKPPGAVLELLKVLLKSRSEEFDVASKLIASAADLEKIARDDEADTPALSGWRREIFGADALRLKRGELALAARGRRVRVLEIDSGAGD